VDLGSLERSFRKTQCGEGAQEGQEEGQEGQEMKFN